jgi:hypothetical protein
MVVIVAICFVVDSTDVERMIEAREELTHLMAEPELLGVPLMVWANKCDMPNSAPLSLITHHLGLFDIENPWWAIPPPKGRPSPPPSSIPPTSVTDSSSSSSPPGGLTLSSSSSSSSTTIPISSSVMASTTERKTVIHASYNSPSTTATTTTSSGVRQYLDHVPNQRAREWNIISTNALNGDGVWQALDWVRLAIGRYHNRYCK